jgi:deoxyribodipyrimidine photolyase-related protein
VSTDDGLRGAEARFTFGHQTAVMRHSYFARRGMSFAIVYPDAGDARARGNRRTASGCSSLVKIRLVLGDQLSPNLSALDGFDRGVDVVLLAEVMSEATYVRHHPKKIALVFSAMRHFATALRKRGVTVRYVTLDDPANGGTLAREVARAVVELGAERVVATHPGEYRLAADMATWSAMLGVPVEIREDSRFICSRTRFAKWAAGRKQFRMEFFYREMRRDTGLLLTADGEPEGDAWNFDADNRKPLKSGVIVPPPPFFKPDAITRGVLDLVGERFSSHFGDLEPFGFAVTAEQAEAILDRFLAECLPQFGDYQDAMKRGEPTLFHSLIAPALNIGLLDPLDVCRRAEVAYREGRAPLNAVEGFIRQIIGWREYVRGIYWLKMPGYAETNFLDAHRRLPEFYWSGDTPMACMAETIGDTKRTAYAHHIQRLMITGNFALLAGIEPREIEAWYLAVYADAYDWVELPNTHGMVMHADGGLLASKPYAASGKYINRMSDYCKGCAYDVKESFGETACPFNYLYWNFLIENRERLRGNHRMGPIWAGVDQMDPVKRDAYVTQAGKFLDSVAPLP